MTCIYNRKKLYPRTDYRQIPIHTRSIPNSSVWCDFN